MSLDIVQRIHDAEPASTWQTEAAMLGFVLRVLAALPAADKPGLVKAPQGGENVAFYAPLGKWVRVNRVAYPDGTLAKILVDSGVGGKNTPAWNESVDDPDLYLAVPGLSSTPLPDLPPVPPPPVVDDRALLKLGEVSSALVAQGMLIDRQNKLLAELIAKPSVTVPPISFPAYSGTLWGMTITLRPKV